MQWRSGGKGGEDEPPRGLRLQAGAGRRHERSHGAGEGVPPQPLPVLAAPRGEQLGLEPASADQDLVPELAHEIQEGPARPRAWPGLGGPLRSAASSQPMQSTAGFMNALHSMTPAMRSLSPPAFGKAYQNAYALPSNLPAPRGHGSPQKNLTPAPDYEPHVSKPTGAPTGRHHAGSPVYVGGAATHPLPPPRPAPSPSTASTTFPTTLSGNWDSQRAAPLWPPASTTDPATPHLPTQTSPSHHAPSPPQGRIQEATQVNTPVMGEGGLRAGPGGGGDSRRGGGCGVVGAVEYLKERAGDKSSSQRKGLSSFPPPGLRGCLSPAALV